MRPGFKLRGGSEREWRLIRLGWLAGRSVTQIAQMLGRSRWTIRERLKDDRLRAPEASGEMARLVADAMCDRLADGLLGDTDQDVKEVVALLQKLAAALKAMPAQAEAQVSGGSADNRADTDEWDDDSEDEIDRLVALGGGVAGRALGHSEDGRQSGAEPAETKSHSPVSVPARMPGYAGTAAGPSAHVVAFGRTWRGEDARWGRIRSLGRAEGGLSAGGAGGADAGGCARGDDRGAERADCDGADGAGHSDLATLAPPA